MEQEDKFFSKGAEVEVSSDEQGLLGSWYTAKVLRGVSRKNRKVLVQYHTLVATNDKKKPLREFVNAVLVRPLPPCEPPGRRFCFSDEVDAFYNDGWWEGVVTAVLPGGDRYSVFFRHSREQIDFNGKDLRLHREWVYGDWVPPLEESTNPSATPVKSVE
ncbi:protein AGENET DOMAIN (AGD)-CONTAINING P1-like [Malania oleifera]|uniref:protein AGENET DOMAIN (AGD)-CONTAINING P1-like n=1 Tax=Malania oleifera TaxID=397392 RepID=UPI0025AE405D|nr:protein AGENET DOMAIN (AGD)-CONTAINING P1-like [Malania oleifera]